MKIYEKGLRLADVILLTCVLFRISLANQNHCAYFQKSNRVLHIERSKKYDIILLMLDWRHELLCLLILGIQNPRKEVAL